MELSQVLGHWMVALIEIHVLIDGILEFSDISF